MFLLTDLWLGADPGNALIRSPALHPPLADWAAVRPAAATFNAAVLAALGGDAHA